MRESNVAIESFRTVGHVMPQKDQEIIPSYVTWTLCCCSLFRRTVHCCSDREFGSASTGWDILCMRIQRDVFFYITAFYITANITASLPSRSLVHVLLPGSRDIDVCSTRIPLHHGGLVRRRFPSR